MTRRIRKKKSPLADLPDFFAPTAEEVEAKKQRAKEVARVKAAAAARTDVYATDIDSEAKARREWRSSFYAD